MNGVIVSPGWRLFPNCTCKTLLGLNVLTQLAPMFRLSSRLELPSAGRPPELVISDCGPE